MSDLPNPPDWAEIQSQFREYIESYNAGELAPKCRDRLFSSVYHAIEYLSVARYRQFAGYGTKQTDLALDNVKNIFWKIDQEQESDAGNGARDSRIGDDESGCQRREKKRRTFTSLITEEYRAEAPLGNFLTKVVGNALRDWLREQNRNRKFNLQVGDDLFAEIFEIGISDVPPTSTHLAWGIGNPVISPEEQIEMNELLTIMANLDEQEQRLVDLYYIQGMSSAEISKVTGINQSTVSTKISRAIQTVRQALQQI